MVTAGVGLNLFKTNLAVRYALSSVYTYAAYTPTWKQTPMINAAVDYGLGKKVSVGVAFGYQRAVGTYTDGVFSFQDTWTRIHLAARGDYYIVATDNISLYTGLKVGYNIYNVSTTVSNTFYPNYITELNVHPSPVSVQAHFGFSYYFAKIVGVNAEVGIGYGGPYLFALGVTIKI